MTEKFGTVVSKVNKPFTYFMMGIIWVAVIMIMIVIGTVFENMYSRFSSALQNDPAIFFFLVLAQILLILCCIALIMALTYRKKQKIRKAIIDDKGVTFYNSRNHIINTILYSELQPVKSLSDDVYMYSTTGRYPKNYLKVYLRNETGEMITATIDFNFEYVVLSNQFEMYRHFLKGIQRFRPDLRINFRTIEEYNLTSDSPRAQNFGMFEWFISGFCILGAAGLIYALLVLIRVFLRQY